MKEIELFPKTGNFAENKDVARELRIKEIIPALENHQVVILDFNKVDSATQSFIHALISDIIRKEGYEIIDRLNYKNCNDTIKKIITIVTDYMQEE
ncbi:MAG: STAS-like domain-containing protein [ANME-2 cluster archaeon]|nr:STAS-like domain-containing protein [ANME-2 cluster archaeon]MBC2706401.1 STAS-like domain-containing protein [ANME-2 cluster archaeon]MBC2747477.1 STAS-like domain-containing protein [ANME-2 cluster archaeon]